LHDVCISPTATVINITNFFMFFRIIVFCPTAKMGRIKIAYNMQGQKYGR
jgi:hypothetical protein